MKSGRWSRQQRRTGRGLSGNGQHLQLKIIPYLRRKGVKPYGLRVSADDDCYPGALVMSLVDESGSISTLQFILADGKKRFLKGGRKRGCYFTIPGRENRLYVAEGFATRRHSSPSHRSDSHFVL